MKTAVFAITLAVFVAALSAFANDPQPIRTFTPQGSIADTARLVDFAQDARNCQGSEPQITVSNVLMYSSAKIRSVTVNSKVSYPRITFTFTDGKKLVYACKDLVTLGLGF